VRIDPLPLFCHARMVVPVLGLSGMYLLIRLIFLDGRKSTLIFVGVLALASGQVVLETKSLHWVNAYDPTRGVFTFMGTAHHADAAMDILLPMTAAILLLFMRQPRWSHGLLLIGILVANFLWHPREFLQAALFLGMVLPVALLLPSLRRRVVFTRWLVTTGILVGVAIGAAALSRACVPRESHFYDESALKRTALEYAVERHEITTVRSLFRFPLHFFLASPNHPDVLSPSDVHAMAGAHWNLDRWWFLAAGATVVLVTLGKTRDRQLAIYHLIFWLLAYCWNFSMLAILALTYSEFCLGMPRLLYLFSYLVIADAALVLATALYRALGVMVGWVPRTPPTLRAVAALVLGFAVLALSDGAFARWAAHHHRSGAYTVGAVLNACCLALLVGVLWFESRRWNGLRTIVALRRPIPMGAALLLIGAALWPLNIKKWPALFEMVRSGAGDPDWFGDKNPMGYSRALIAWARALPAGHRIAANPLDIAMLTVYTPQYLCVQPVGSVIADAPERERAERGEHPFYRPEGLPTWRADHAAAIEWLRRRKAGYVLINRYDYDSPALAYFQAHSDCYELVFENSLAREAVFRVR
jgi:hypothetical protein